MSKSEKKNIENNIKNIGIFYIIFGIVFIITLVIIGCFIFSKKESKEELLSKSLENMSKDYYENFYYNQIGTTEEDRSEFLSRYETIGIKINLENLSSYSKNDNSKILKQFINEDTNKECDKKNTKGIIYPTKPYSKTSYKIETQLDCGFTKEK